MEIHHRYRLAGKQVVLGLRPTLSILRLNRIGSLREYHARTLILITPVTSARHPLCTSSDHHYIQIATRLIPLGPPPILNLYRLNSMSMHLPLHLSMEPRFPPPDAPGIQARVMQTVTMHPGSKLETLSRTQYLPCYQSHFIG